VWRLVKTIWRGHGTDLHRFEKNIVARISTHAGCLSNVAPAAFEDCGV
jgi:hypothetical protein